MPLHVLKNKKKKKRKYRVKHKRKLVLSSFNHQKTSLPIQKNYPQNVPITKTTKITNIGAQKRKRETNKDYDHGTGKRARIEANTKQKRNRTNSSTPRIHKKKKTDEQSTNRVVYGAKRKRNKTSSSATQIDKKAKPDKIKEVLSRTTNHANLLKAAGVVGGRLKGRVNYDSVPVQGLRHQSHNSVINRNRKARSARSSYDQRFMHKARMVEAFNKAMNKQGVVPELVRFAPAAPRSSSKTPLPQQHTRNKPNKQHVTQHPVAATTPAERARNRQARRDMIEKDLKQSSRRIGVKHNSYAGKDGTQASFRPRRRAKSLGSSSGVNMYVAFNNALAMANEI